MRRSTAARHGWYAARPPRPPGCWTGRPRKKPARPPGRRPGLTQSHTPSILCCSGPGNVARGGACRSGRTWCNMHPDGEQLLTVSPTRARKPEPDEICAQAVDLARAAAVEVAGPDYVGEHVGADAEADRLVTHLFACLDPAYRGWRWAVTLTPASRAKAATVGESVLVPGPDSIRAPEWVPWRERLRPGDLGVGDILPAPADDERLVPAVSLAGDDGVTDVDDLAAIVAGLSEPFAGNPVLIPPQG